MTIFVESKVKNISPYLELSIVSSVDFSHKKIHNESNILIVLLYFQWDYYMVSHDPPYLLCIVYLHRLFVYGNFVVTNYSLFPCYFWLFFICFCCLCFKLQISRNNSCSVKYEKSIFAHLTSESSFLCLILSMGLLLPWWL